MMATVAAPCSRGETLDKIAHVHRDALDGDVRGVRVQEGCSTSNSKSRELFADDYSACGSPSPIWSIFTSQARHG